MEINLEEKISEHFDRLESLADEAEGDVEESYSSRASAMGALTGMLRDLVNLQGKVINMERLIRIEALTIETLQKHLSEKQHEDFLKDLEDLLNVK